MRLTLFLSRIAFICNVFFLLALLVKGGVPPGSQDIVGFIGIIGYGMVALFNPLVNLIYMVLLLRRKLAITVPRWLALTNFIFLLLQIQYLLFLNGVFNT
jgi:hypothetical protein